VTHPLIQLIPDIVNACGVHDYSLRLASEWHPSYPPSQDIHRLTEVRSLKSIEFGTPSPSGPVGILLHYSGYGYAKRGAPLWLLRSVQLFRRKNPAVPWLTMFHEVAASGPINTSAFWMRPLQLWIAKRLLQISDTAFTNCAMNAAALHLAVRGQSQKVRIIPVFSNFGEPVALPPVPERAPHLILFTSNLAGRNPSPDFWQTLQNAVSSHRVTKVTVIGRPLTAPPTLTVPIEQTGFLDYALISTLLCQARYGFAYHAPLLFGKSTIFAAFAAHGVIPIVPSPPVSLPEDLQNGEHYLSSTDNPLQRDLQKIQNKLIAWYQPHNLKATAKAYIESLDRFIPR